MSEGSKALARFREQREAESVRSLEELSGSGDSSSDDEAQAREMEMAELHRREEAAREAKERDEEQKRDKDYQRQFLDSMLEDYYTEKVELGGRQPLNDVSGNVELQRLMAALRFLLEDVDVRGSLLRDAGKATEIMETRAAAAAASSAARGSADPDDSDDAPDVDAVALVEGVNTPGSLAAATSQTATVLIGNERQKERRDRERERRRVAAAAEAEKKHKAAAAAAAAEGNGESGGAGKGGAGGAPRRTTRRVRRKPAAEAEAEAEAKANEAGAGEDDSDDDSDGDDDGAAAAAAGPSGQNYHDLMNRAKESRQNTAFGKEFRRCVGVGLAEAELERYEALWEDFGLAEDFPIVTEFERESLARLTEYLADRCQEQKEVLELEMAGDGAIKRFDEADVMASLQDQFHWRLQNALADLRRIETAPLSYHSGGFLFRVDNLLAVLLYRRKFAGAAAAERQRADEEQQKRRVKRAVAADRVRFMKRLLSVFDSDRRNMALMLGAMLAFLVVAGVVVITATGITEVDDNMSRGIFFLNQENEGRARSFTQETLSQPLAAQEVNLASAAALLDVDNSILQGLTTAESNDPTGTLDRHLVRIVRQYGAVKNAFIASGNHYISAYRLGVSGPHPQTAERAPVRIVATGVFNTTFDPDGFLASYEVHDDGRRVLGTDQSVELTTPTFVPDDEVWGNATSPQWSPVHEALRVESTGEGGTLSPDDTGGLTVNFHGVMTYVVPLLDRVGGDQIGLFGVEISTADLGSMLADVDVWRGGQVYVCDSEWNVVATTSGEVDLASGDATARHGEVTTTVGSFRQRFAHPAGGGLNADLAALLDNDDAILESDTGGVEFLLALAFQEGVRSSLVSAADLDSSSGTARFPEWTLVVAVERSDLFGIIDSNLLLSYALGCSALALAGALTLFSHRLVAAQNVGGLGSLPSSSSASALNGGGGGGGGGKARPSIVRVNSGRFVDQQKLQQAKAGALFCFVAVIVVLLLIWALWSRSASRSTGEISGDLEAEASERVFQDVRRVLSAAARAALLTRAGLADGAVVQPSGTANETLDRYFSHLVSGMATGALAQFVTHVRVARDDGELAGAKAVRNWTAAGGTGTNWGLPLRVDEAGDPVPADDQDGWGLLVTAKDADSVDGNCYREYVSKPGPDLGNRVQSLVRDLDVPAARSSPGCLYKPTEQAWYTAASGVGVAEGEVVYTPAYRLEFDGTIGGTYSVRVADAGGGVGAVVAADVTFGHVSEMLLQVLREGDGGSSTVENNPRTILLQRTGELVASSEPEDRERVEEIGPFQGAQSNDADTAGTVKYLERREGGLDSFVEDTRVPRVLDDPITSVGVLDSCCGSNALLAVVDLPFDAFFEEFDRVLLLATLLCFGTFVLTAYLLSASLIAFRDKVLNKNEFRSFEREQQKLLSILGGDTVNKKTLLRLMADLRRPVVTACAHSWRRRVARRDERLAPVEFDALRQHYADTAIKHIRGSYNGRNVLLFCELQSRGQTLQEEYNPAKDDPWPFRIYRWFTSLKYRLFLHAVIVFHIGLFFLEPDTYDDLRANGVSNYVLFAEFVCLGVELLDLIAKLLITYRFDTHTVPFTDVSVRADIMYVVVLTLVALDFGLTLGFNFSFEYLFPLRPLILLLRNDHVRDTAHQFLRTLYYARDVFLLYLCIVLTAAAMGTILFRTVITTEGPESSFENYIRALTTAFVYISTGENFTELVYPAWDQSGLYMVYFFTFMFIGMFVVLAMVIGVFSNGFQSQRKAKARKQQIFSRLGTVAAFVLLDMDGNESLSRHEFKAFLDRLRPGLNRHALDALFRSINKNDDEDLDVAEFVQGVEEIVWHRLILQTDIVQQSKPRLFFRFFVFEQEWFQKVVIVVTLMNIWLLSLYGTLERERLLDGLGAGFIIFMSAEMALRVYAYGFDEFWNYARFNGPKGRNPIQVLTSNHGVFDMGAQDGAGGAADGFDDGDDGDSYADDASSRAGSGGVGSPSRRRPSSGADSELFGQAQQTEHGFLRGGVTSADRLVEKQRLAERQRALDDSLAEAARVRAARGGAGGASGLAGGAEAEAAEYELAADRTKVLREQQPVFGPNAENVNQMYANRYDLVLITFSAVAFVWSRVWVGSFTFAEDEDVYRFVMTFPALRIFSVVRRTRLLVFTLVKLLPRIASIVAVMIVVFFLYAVVGVWLFADKWADLQDRATPGNFDNITEAMLTLFQMLVGESWHLIMYAAVRATRGFGSSWYFISFIIVVTLLFVNTLIAVILDAFHEVFEAQRQERIRIQRARLDKLQAWRRDTSHVNLAAAAPRPRVRF